MRVLLVFSVSLGLCGPLSGCSPLPRVPASPCPDTAPLPFPAIVGDTPHGTLLIPEMGPPYGLGTGPLLGAAYAAPGPVPLLLWDRLSSRSSLDQWHSCWQVFRGPAEPWYSPPLPDCVCACGTYGYGETFDLADFAEIQR
jgi:hypothetical protein